MDILLFRIQTAQEYGGEEPPKEIDTDTLLQGHEAPKEEELSIGLNPNHPTGEAILGHNQALHDALKM